MPNDAGLDARSSLHTQTVGGEKDLEDFIDSPRTIKTKRAYYIKHSVDIVGLLGFDAPNKPFFNLGEQSEASDTIPGDSREFSNSSLYNPRILLRIIFKKIFGSFGTAACRTDRGYRSI
jgi:hypothetical protein